jgi:hypothetical protein
MEFLRVKFAIKLIFFAAYGVTDITLGMIQIKWIFEENCVLWLRRCEVFAILLKERRKISDFFCRIY